MALDIYVGSMTRYFTRAWETIGQSAGRELGIQTVVLRLNDQPVPQLEEMHAAATHWRDGLSQALARHGVPPFSWDETQDSPWFTHRPTWDCFFALQIWAAHLDYPQHKMPSVAPMEAPEYPPLHEILATGKSRFLHLLGGVELWLPQHASFPFDATHLTGHTVRIGSVYTLLRELELLNELTWRVDDATLSEWQRYCPSPGVALEDSAKFGYAIMRGMAAQAVQHGLPMTLDY